ncbi:MAG: hypothetical protein KO464_01085 [Candidatus Methanofastidiosum sp.]|nr:hypothetical protein [Methanofastidiosum sp.]
MQKKHLKIFSFIAVVLVFGLCFSWVNANYQIENPLGDSSDIFDIIDRVLSFLLWAAITMGVFVIMWAGYIYMTSQGKPEKAAMAGRVIFNVLIGIAIILLSKGIISLTHYVLTGEPTTV